MVAGAEIFLSACLGAILSTIPIGPINLILMQAALERRWKSWLICLVAAVLADGIICLGALAFFDFIKEHVEPYIRFSPLVLGSFLILSGLGMFLRQPIPADVQVRNRSLVAFFIFSFFLTLSGPALVPFWLSWWSSLHLSSPSLAWAALGFLIGDVAIFGAYALLVLLFPKPGFAMQTKIAKGLSVVLVIIGVLVLGAYWSGVSLKLG